MEIDIMRLAKLAKLSIPEDKVEEFRKKMEDIIRMVENLPDLDTEGSLVDPADTMELRKDEVKPSFPRDEMLRKFRNSPHPYNDYCDFLRIKYNLNVSAKEIIERRYAIAQYYLENVVDYKKDADTFVHKLSELGYVLAIASTTKRSNIDVYRHQNSNIISKADIDTYFKLVLTREDAVAMKPSPDIYLKCLDLLGADVEECIVLEDSLVGVEAAKAAGLTTVGVYDKYSDGDRYEISKLADFTVNEYSELIEMLEHL